MILEEETYIVFGYYPSDLKPQSHKKILAKCDDCGKIRAIAKRGYRSICPSCVKKGENNPNWKGGLVKRICETCGKEFEARLSDINKGYGKLCSKSCAHEGFKGENHPNWKGGKVKRICETCGKEFEVQPSQIKRGWGRFCSHECHGEWLSKHQKGENNPQWQGGLVKRVCETCGKEFEARPSDVKKGRGKFCSYLCSRKARRFPKHHTKPELIFEEICRKNNLSFHYVGDGALWIGKKGEKQLNPDFIEANGKKVCVEIMGAYWHSPLLNQTIKEERTLEYRMKFYRKYKWQSIFIWDTDLLREDAEQFVLNTLKRSQI